ncbi:MAG TPA: hypothetical protein VKB88_32700 [Bryobacteraceae bacterium]|nr:hypothetical protein [Bryobacteraceae bacterium]
MSRRFIARFCILATGPAALVSLLPASQSPAQSVIEIRVQQGEGAINSIRLHHAHDPVVAVVDAAGRPLTGATVTFLLPALGASGTFQDNGLSLTVETDSRGLATGRGLRPNRIAGPFHIHVTASSEGRSASATITETNAEPVAQSSHSKTIIILAIVGGAAAAGAAVAAHGGKSSSSDTGANTAGGSAGATITAGTPSLGPPH